MFNVVLSYDEDDINNVLEELANNECIAEASSMADHRPRVKARSKLRE